MQRLNDIAGYWNMLGNWNFNDKDMWQGKIILEEDGWFEGIVSDLNSSYKGDRFVFGFYYPDKYIELFKVSPINVSGPLIFRCARDAKGYGGQFTTVGIFGEMPCGNAHIITRDVEYFKESGFLDDNNRDFDEEIVELLEKIDEFKSTDVFWELYEDALATRESKADILKRNGVGIYSVDNKMVDDLQGGIKKLVKKNDNESV